MVEFKFNCGASNTLTNSSISNETRRFSSRRCLREKKSLA